MRNTSPPSSDVVVVLEVAPELRAILAAALPDYQLLAEPRTDSFGIALLSRIPVQAELRALGTSELPAIEARFEHQGERYALLAVHTLPPVSGEYSRGRDSILAEVGQWARSQSEHAIVVGDLNATPSSSAFRMLLEESRLVNSQRGFGVQSSWPRQIWPLSIPIDHCLHSAGLTTVRRSVGPFLGFDHRPLHVALAPR